MADKKAIATASAIIGKATGYMVPPEALDTWALILKPLPNELLIAATVAACRKAERSLPIPPGAIFSEAMKIVGEQYPTPIEAWRLAYDWSWGDVATDSIRGPILATAHAIGREALRGSPAGDFTTRAHFTAEYERQRQRAAEKTLGTLYTPEAIAAMLGKAEEAPALEEEHEP